MAIQPHQRRSDRADNEPTVRIEVRDRRGETTSIILRSEDAIIGRSVHADVRLDDPEVSRRHAELFCDPFGRWWIHDLGSRNGIKVNDVRVGEQILMPGDEIRIRPFLLTFCEAKAAEPLALPAEASDVPVEDTDSGDISSLDDAEPPKIDTAHFNSLTEFGHRLQAVDGGDERLRLLCRTMVRRDFHGLCAMALRLSLDHPDRPAQTLCPPQCASNWPEEAVYISRNVVQVLRKTQAPVLASNIASTPGVVEISLSPELSKLTVIACPLRDHERDLDLLYVMLPPQFAQPEWLAVTALAARQYQEAEAAWVTRHHARDNALIAQDLERACQIQRRLVPSDVDIGGLEMAIGFKPCRWVGGDYVDVVPTTDGRYLFAVADVSGKGLPAAMVTSSIHTMVHMSARAGLSLGDMFTGFNEYLCEHLDDRLFVTMTCMLIDPRTGAVECANAGHLPGLILDSQGDVQSRLMATALPLGIQPQTVETQTADLAPGHLLAMYTDGLTEMPTGEGRLLGLDGVARQLGSIYSASHQTAITQIADEITRWLDDLTADQMVHDDRSFLVIRRP